MSATRGQPMTTSTEQDEHHRQKVRPSGTASVMVSVEFHESDHVSANVEDAFTVTSQDVRFSVAQELRAIADRLDPS